MEHGSTSGCRFVLLHISKNTHQNQNSPVRRSTHGGIFFSTTCLIKNSLLSLWREEGVLLEDSSVDILSLLYGVSIQTTHYILNLLTSQQIKRQIESTMQQKQHGVLFVIIAEL